MHNHVVLELALLLETILLCLDPLAVKLVRYEVSLEASARWRLNTALSLQLTFTKVTLEEKTIFLYFSGRAVQLSLHKETLHVVIW